MRPAVFQVGGTLYWVIQTRNPDTMLLKDADSTPSVAVRKNGASVADSVTITKRSATTGIYDCSYNPAAEVEGDSFTLEESATVTGTTTSSATYTQTWNARVVAVERGTDSANTTTPPTAAVVADAVWDEARSGHATAGTFGEKVNAELDSSVIADIADIKADAAAAAGYGADLVSKITSNVASALAKLWYMISGTGAASKFTAGALEDAPTGSEGGGQTDWTDEEKAQIRYRLGLDGTATAPAEPDVDPIVITPATGIMTTGYLVTRVKGVATASIKIYYQHVEEPLADRGSSYDDTVYSSTSNSEGIAELSLVKAGLYYIWRSSATRPKDCIAYRVLKADGTAPDSTLELPSHIGH